MNSTSAPALAAASPRRSASSKSTAEIASVRAMTRRSGSVRASTEARRRGTVAGHVDGGEARLLDELRGDPVVGARYDESLLRLDERAEGAATCHARPPLARAIRRSSAGCE